ncbi:zinc-dependent metalloprotease [Brevibacterium daeguense]|nr:zinc-dependent metalloprotease [Brevibacterium daeguense]
MSLISERIVTATARELMPAGPMPAPADAAALVENLHDAAETAIDLVLDVMRLQPDVEDGARGRLAAGQTRVVDRLGWVGANARTFSRLLDDASPPGRGGIADRIRDRAARTGASVELGGALALVGSRVLGQFDPFAGPAGTLYLVAPTVLEVETAIRARPRDFRLWVALHEQTHHVQFAAAPWLADHLRERIGALLEPMLDASGLDGLQDTLRSLPAALRNRESLLDAVVAPSQRALVDEVGALMSLLEGHADFVMDAVGPRVIPTVRSIRRSFDVRRHEAAGLRSLVSTLLGVDEKLAQYRRGAEFVRAVVAERGHGGLAPVWHGAENLPTAAEIAAPRLWLDRTGPTR